jgi:hypothetical protein
MVNGGVTINGHYQANPNMQSMCRFRKWIVFILKYIVLDVHQINGNIQTIPKPPTAAIVTCPPRTQRLVHSEAYLR